MALLLQVIGVVAVGTAAGYLIFKSSLLILVVWPALGCLSIAMVAALCPYAKEWFVVLMATVMHVSLYAFGVAIGGGHTFVEGLSAFVEDLLKWDSGVRVMVFGWLLQVALGLVLAWRKGRLS